MGRKCDLATALLPKGDTRATNAKTEYHGRVLSSRVFSNALAPCFQGLSAGRGEARLTRGTVGAEEGFKILADPVGESSLAEDGPVERGAAVDLLDEAGEFGGVAGDEFAGGEGGVEEFARFFAHGFKLRESDGVEFGIGEINLQVSETVGHGLRSGGEAGAVHEELDQCFQRRGVFGAGCGELFDYGGWSGFHGGEKQGALGAEALDERSGNDAGFLGDVSEGDLRGTEALHDAPGSGEDFGVGGFAGAGRHFDWAPMRRRFEHN
jgi:hypothetical protein